MQINHAAAAGTAGRQRRVTGRPPSRRRRSGAAQAGNSRRQSRRGHRSPFAALARSSRSRANRSLNSGQASPSVARFRSTPHRCPRQENTWFELSVHGGESLSDDGEVVAEGISTKCRAAGWYVHRQRCIRPREQGMATLVAPGVVSRRSRCPCRRLAAGWFDELARCRCSADVQPGFGSATSSLLCRPPALTRRPASPRSRSLRIPWCDPRHRPCARARSRLAGMAELCFRSNRFTSLAARAVNWSASHRRHRHCCPVDVAVGDVRRCGSSDKLGPPGDVRRRAHPRAHRPPGLGNLVLLVGTARRCCHAEEVGPRQAEYRENASVFDVALRSWLTPCGGLGYSRSRSGLTGDGTFRPP